MPGNESFTWDHVVVWSSDAIAQSFRLHFYVPQFYSGELFLSIQTILLPSTPPEGIFVSLVEKRFPRFSDLCVIVPCSLQLLLNQELLYLATVGLSGYILFVVVVVVVFY